MSSFSKFQYFLSCFGKISPVKEKVDANVDAVPATRLNQHGNLDDLIE
jgi:hypothetical protein